MCFALLQAGADKTVQDKGGNTSKYLAESRNRGKIAVLLNNWRPVGLTATQTQKIKESRGEGPIRFDENKLAVEPSRSLFRSQNRHPEQRCDGQEGANIGHTCNGYCRGAAPFSLFLRS